jgi:hypothetical protein
MISSAISFMWPLTVRHGHLPEREIVTGVGPIVVRAPRVGDRAGRDGERIRLSSAICRLRAPIKEPRGADPDPLPQGAPTWSARADRLSGTPSLT